MQDIIASLKDIRVSRKHVVNCCGVCWLLVAVLLGLLWWDITALPRKFQGSEDVEKFYSEWKWENIGEYYWEDHVHLGYWENPENETWDLATMRKNKMKVVEKMLEFGLAGASDALKQRIASASPKQPLQILDLGCGIGGSARWLAQHFGTDRVNVTGITITHYQVTRGNNLTAQKGVKNVKLVWGDILDMERTAGLHDKSFDIIWSLESEHHISEKVKMAQEVYRVLKPGGLLIVNSQNRRATPALTDEEKDLLDYIEAGGSCPEWSTVPAMEKHFTDAGLTQTYTEDWGRQIGIDWWISLYVGFVEDDMLSRWWAGTLELPLRELRLLAKDMWIIYQCSKAYVGEHPPAEQGMLRGTRPLSS